MKLWKISQDVNNDYDTYDCAVVAAETIEEARRIHPSEYFDESDPCRFDSWTEFENVKVSYIGEAKKGTKSGVICASFHAG